MLAATPTFCHEVYNAHHALVCFCSSTPLSKIRLVGIWLSANIGHCLFDCNELAQAVCTRSYSSIPLWIASASLSGISMLNSSSIAITTSTVSKLSRPRSFEKCDCPVICYCQLVAFSTRSHIVSEWQFLQVFLLQGIWMSYL